MRFELRTIFAVFYGKWFGLRTLIGKFPLEKNCKNLCSFPNLVLSNILYMQRREKVRSSNQEVYRCPFCRCEIWFDRDSDLVLHLFKKHLRQTLYEFAKGCKVKVSKKLGKWMVANGE